MAMRRYGLLEVYSQVYNLILAAVFSAEGVDWLLCYTSPCATSLVVGWIHGHLHPYEWSSTRVRFYSGVQVT
jgi:hypothetical protein